ncbi:BlaI/MecI/CopY family transcriptional regulator [Amycolatopsis acididurans]|uniref:BlaI/MecI/CopY family transcriptional regulator n=1 Tax=Amycolatopsis acididurans TaxID=2724524 RepID=UPI001FEC35D9|nr:BlaI/MecI/CopY family transcriptional regulator [Amycolatopsis acididurans]
MGSQSGREDGGENVGRSARRRAGELSGQVLEVLRQATAALTPADVQRRLSAAGTGPLSYSTVVTTLSRLHEQGAVERYRTGRAFAYLAVADSALAARRMRRVLDDQADHEAVLATFVNDLSPADERRLRALLGDPDTGAGSRE